MRGFTTTRNRFPAVNGVSATPESAVLHVALEPTSGVWSVMRDLSRAQVESGRYQAVAMGVIASAAWPAKYAEEFEELRLPHFRSPTLNAFGTAKFLWQRIQPPPIGVWADDLARASGASSVVVHIHNAWLSGVFLPLRTNGQGRTIPVVTFHGVCITLEGQPVRRWLHRYMAQRLVRYGARLTSVDAGSLPAAHSLFGLSPDRFRIIPNGVKPEESLHAAEWKGQGEFRVGYVGLLAEHKGWRILADAVLAARAAGRNVRLLIAGAGLQEPMARAAAQEHPEAIKFLGYVSEPRRNLMPRLHALALPSAYEGLPMILIEAASVGLPVVATAVGGVREIVEEGVTGKVVERSAGSVAKALETLYDSPDMMSQMGRAARAVHAARFEIGRVVGLYHQVYTGQA